MSSTAVAPRARKTFSRLKHVLDLPNLIDIQKASFEWFLDEGLRETIDDISPIEDYTGTLAVEFGEYEFGDAAVLDPGVPREGPDLPGAALDDRPLRQQGDGRDPRAAGLHGRLPDDDRAGHVHHQRHRARDRHAARPQPGRLPDGAEGRDEAGLHREPDADAAARGSSSRSTRRASSTPASTGSASCRSRRSCARSPAEDPTTGFALDTSSNEAILELFDDSTAYIQNTLDKDTSTREEEALIEVFKKQRPGEPPTLDNARNLLRALFFDPKRYDLTKVGRYKLNQRLGVDVPDDTRVLTTRTSSRSSASSSTCRRSSASPRGREGLRRRGGRAQPRPDPRRARRVRALRQPAAAHDRRADPGGVPRRPLPDGARRPRADDDGGRRHDHAADDHQHPARRRGAEGVLRLLAALAVHGPDELARRAHAPAPPLGARRRRPHPRARADRGARRPPDPLRAHVPDRDAGGPEHRPDRLARVDGDRVRVRLHPDAVPGRQGRQGDGRDHLPRRRRGGAVHDRAGLRAGRREDGQVPERPGALPLERWRGRHRRAEGRRVHGRRAGADRLGRDRADPVPRAQRREPRADGREHAAAGSAADDPAGAARRHRPRVPRRDRHRRRRPRADATAP